MTKNTKMSKTKRNFRVTIEQPRVVHTKNDSDIAVDRYITYVYGVYNLADVREVLTLPQKLSDLRKQGLRITKPQMLTADITIERI